MSPVVPRPRLYLTSRDAALPAPSLGLPTSNFNEVPYLEKYGNSHDCGRRRLSRILFSMRERKKTRTSQLRVGLFSARKKRQTLDPCFLSPFHACGCNFPIGSTVLCVREEKKTAGRALDSLWDYKVVLGCVCPRLTRKTGRSIVQKVLADVGGHL